MYREHTVAAVIPAYNEEAFIGEVLETLPAFVDCAYVIDDASTDDTWAQIHRHADDKRANGGRVVAPPRPDPEADPQAAEIVPIQHAENRGVGGAIKTGYARALADGYDVAVVIAGDGQMEPDVVERVLGPVATGRVDYAKGNRLLSPDGMPRFRQVGNYLLSVLTKVASGYWKVNDPQNGLTAISRTALERIDIDALYEDYGFANDLLVHLNVHDLRVADVPCRAVYKDESSDIVYSSFIPKASWLLLTSFLWRLHAKYLRRDFHPLALFYYLGAGSTAVGATTLAYALVTLSPVAATGGAVLFVLGWTLVLQAMVYDLQENEALQEIGHPVEHPPDPR